jgi:putative FmdB family regulatory protein
MPTYDYQCDACGHRFDLFQSMLDKPIKKCPKCHRLKVRRLLGTGGGVIFKGSGFYQTDYRSESYKKAASADNGSDGKKSETKSESKSESKSETKSEPAKKAESKAKKD